MQFAQVRLLSDKHRSGNTREKNHVYGRDGNVTATLTEN